MQNIMIFENNQVEVFELNGQVLFNPYDVGRCLDLTESAVRKAILEMNERQVIKLTNSDVNNSNIQNSKVNNTDFRKLNNAGENFLTESGVYKLIFKSRKPNAEKFQDWVTDEVLPSIRKTGKYEAPTTVTGFLELSVQAIKELEVKVDNVRKEVKQDLEDFKQDMPLLALEIEHITKARNKIAVALLGGKESKAYKDKSIRGKVYSDLSREVKRQFGVDTYKAIKRSDCQKVLNIIENYKLPLCLVEEINKANGKALQLAI